MSNRLYLWTLSILLFSVLVLYLTACGKSEEDHTAIIGDEIQETETVGVVEQEEELAGIQVEKEIREEVPVEMPEDVNQEEIVQDPIGEMYTTANNGYLIVIDAGHQSKGNSDQESVGPGAGETKAKVSSGTSGKTSGLAEYELTLQLALKLQSELEDRGYDVIMVRTSNDVDISNSERAAVANEANADVFIRIHANGSEDTSVNGAMTICQTSGNPYNAALYSQSKSLSTNVLDELVAATGCKKQYVWETDTMSGINWCQVPVTIVEVGYMTNPTEDVLLATEDYQYKVAAGIANGVDRYLELE